MTRLLAVWGSRFPQSVAITVLLSMEPPPADDQTTRTARGQSTVRVRASQPAGASPRAAVGESRQDGIPRPAAGHRRATSGRPRVGRLGRRRRRSITAGKDAAAGARSRSWDSPRATLDFDSPSSAAMLRTDSPSACSSATARRRCVRSGRRPSSRATRTASSSSSSRILWIASTSVLSRLSRRPSYTSSPECGLGLQRWHSPGALLRRR